MAQAAITIHTVSGKLHTLPPLICELLNRANDDCKSEIVKISCGKIGNWEKVLPALIKVLKGKILHTSSIDKFSSTTDPFDYRQQLVIDKELSVAEKVCIEVRPLPLGSVALPSVPLTRSASHPTTLEPQNWTLALSRVPWRRRKSQILDFDGIRTRIKSDNDVVLYYAEPLSHGLGGNRFTEYKLPTNLKIVTSDTIKRYLFESCTPNLNGLPFGAQAELWIGVEEGIHCVVGVPLMSLEKSICGALLHFAKKLTPNLSPEQIFVHMYPTLEWPVSLQSLPRAYLHVKGEVTERDFGFLVGLCWGLCRVYEKTDIDEEYLIEVPRAVQKMLYFEDEVDDSLLSNDGESDARRILRQISKNIRERLQKSHQTWLKSVKDLWRSDHPFTESELDWTVVERAVVRISFTSDKATEHTYYLHEGYGSKGFEGYAPLKSAGYMSRLQLWLRLKGLADGARRANVFLPLTSRSTCKFLLTASPEDNRLLVDSVRQYMDGHAVATHSLLASEISTTDKFYESAGCSSVYILATYKGLVAATKDSLLMRILPKSDQCPVKLIVFIGLDDATDDADMVLQNSVLSIVDVATLWNDPSRSSMKIALTETSYLLVASAAESSFERSFQRVPTPTAHEPVKDMQEVRSDTLRWINREISIPTWDMVRTGFVFVTDQCKVLLNEIGKRRNHKTSEGEISSIKVFLAVVQPR